jgi:hypothetical protein
MSTYGCKRRPRPSTASRRPSRTGATRDERPHRRPRAGAARPMPSAAGRRAAAPAASEALELVTAHSASRPRRSPRKASRRTTCTACSRAWPGRTRRQGRSRLEAQGRRLTPLDAVGLPTSGQPDHLRRSRRHQPTDEARSHAAIAQPARSDRPLATRCQRCAALPAAVARPAPNDNWDTVGWRRSAPLREIQRFRSESPNTLSSSVEHPGCSRSRLTACPPVRSRCTRGSRPCGGT